MQTPPTPRIPCREHEARLTHDFIVFSTWCERQGSRRGPPCPAVALYLNVTDASGSTLGGYVTSLLGRLPKKGDEGRIGSYDVRSLSLSLVRGRAVNRLRLTRRQPTPTPTPELPKKEKEKEKGAEA